MVMEYVALTVEELGRIVSGGQKAIAELALEKGVKTEAVKRSVSALAAANDDLAARAIAQKAHEKILTETAMRAAAKKGLEEGAKKGLKKGTEEGVKQGLKKGVEQGGKGFFRSFLSLFGRTGRLPVPVQIAALIGVLLALYFGYRWLSAEPPPREVVNYSGLKEAVEEGMQTGPPSEESPFAAAMRRGELVAAEEPASPESIDLTSWSGLWVRPVFQESWLDRVFIRQSGSNLSMEFEVPNGFIVGDGQGGQTVNVSPGDHKRQGQLADGKVRVVLSDKCTVTLTLLDGGVSIDVRVEAEGGGFLGPGSVTLVRKAAPPAWSGVERE